MPELKIYKSKTKALKQIALVIPLIATGIWMINTTSEGTAMYLFYWVSTCLFCLGIPMGVYHLLDRKPQIVMNEVGIWDRSTLQDFIRWEQIKEVYPIYISRHKYITIVTDDTFFIDRKTLKWNSFFFKKLSARNITLYLGHLSIDENVFSNFINTLSKMSLEERKKILTLLDKKGNNYFKKP